MQWWWDYYGLLNGVIVGDLIWEPGSYGLPRILDDSYRYWIIPYTNGFTMKGKQAVTWAGWDGTEAPPKPPVTVIAAEPGKVILSTVTLTDAQGGSPNTFDRDWILKYNQTHVAWGEVEHGTCGGGRAMGQGLAMASPTIFTVPNVMDSPNVDDEVAPLNFSEKDWSAIGLAIFVKLTGNLSTWTSESEDEEWCGGQMFFTPGTVDMTLEYADGSPVLDRDGNPVQAVHPVHEINAQLGYIIEGQEWRPMQLRLTSAGVNSVRVNIIVMAYIQGKPSNGDTPPDLNPTPIPQVQFPVGSGVASEIARSTAVKH